MGHRFQRATQEHQEYKEKRQQYTKDIATKTTSEQKQCSEVKVLRNQKK